MNRIVIAEVLLVILIVMGIAICLDAFLKWNNNASEQRYPYIKFKNFKVLYEIAPDKWEWDTWGKNVTYCGQKFKLKGLDSKRLEKWDNQRRKRKKEKEFQQILNESIKMWKADIERYEAKSNEEMRQALMQNQQVVNRMSSDF